MILYISIGVLIYLLGIPGFAFLLGWADRRIGACMEHKPGDAWMFLLWPIIMPVVMALAFVMHFSDFLFKVYLRGNRKVEPNSEADK